MVAPSVTYLRRTMVAYLHTQRVIECFYHHTQEVVEARLTGLLQSLSCLMRSS